MIAKMVNVPPWFGVAREVAECWTLRKGTRVAICHLWTHPKGGEARLTVDGNLDDLASRRATQIRADRGGTPLAR